MGGVVHCDVPSSVVTHIVRRMCRSLCGGCTVPSRSKLDVGRRDGAVVSVVLLSSTKFNLVLFFLVSDKKETQKHLHWFVSASVALEGHLGVVLSMFR